MRVIVTEFRQESNSFSPVRSDLRFWRRAGWVLDDEHAREHHRGNGTAVRGMVEVLDAHAGSACPVEVIVGPCYYAQSAGPVEEEVLDAYLTALEPLLRASLPLDIVLVSFHGALQTVADGDAEAIVTRRIREIVGEACVIAASTDLHGFVSRELMAELDLVCGYRTYPHIDFVETGRRAARLALRSAAGRRPAIAWAPVPMIVSASAYSTLAGPVHELIERAERMIADGRILDASIYLVQPWLDTPEAHSTVVVVAEDDARAELACTELAEALFGMRHDLTVALTPVDEILDLAAREDTPRPVVLVESADSPNAGAPGDSMAVAARSLERAIPLRLAIVVADREAAILAHRLGVGAQAEFALGASVDAAAVSVRARARVRSLHDGSFTLEGAGSSGATSELGRAAVLRIGEHLDVLVCEQLVAPGDPQLYRAFGMEFADYDLVVVKANTSFRAGYAAISSVILDADLRGSADPDLARVPFARLDRSRRYPWSRVAFIPAAYPGRRPHHPAR